MYFCASGSHSIQYRDELGDSLWESRAIAMLYYHIIRMLAEGCQGKRDVFIDMLLPDIRHNLLSDWQVDSEEFTLRESKDVSRGNCNVRINIKVVSAYYRVVEVKIVKVMMLTTGVVVCFPAPSALQNFFENVSRTLQEFLRNPAIFLRILK